MLLKTADGILLGKADEIRYGSHLNACTGRDGHHHLMAPLQGGTGLWIGIDYAILFLRTFLIVVTDDNAHIQIIQFFLHFLRGGTDEIGHDGGLLSKGYRQRDGGAHLHGFALLDTLGADVILIVAVVVGFFTIDQIKVGIQFVGHNVLNVLTEKTGNGNQILFVTGEHGPKQEESCR